MSVNKTKHNSKGIKHNSNFCCTSKQYYSNNNGSLVNTLKIIPRVIIFRKSLKIKKIYESVINITNNGLQNRHLSYSTDSCDTAIRVYSTQPIDNFLPPDKSLQIIVRIKPVDKAKLNCRRHIFIDCKHPNITFSIPIIVFAKNDTISLPSSIVFPSTTVQNFTYYEMIFFNMFSKKLQFSIKSPLPHLTVHAKLFNILKKDYAKVLLKLNCKECKVINGVMRVRLSTGDSFVILFAYEPMKSSIFVDNIYINFDTLCFNREETTEFTVCNESNKDIMFHVEFALEEEILLDSIHRSSKRETLLDSQNAIESQIEQNDFVSKAKFIDKYSNRHFEIKPISATIPANSSYNVQVIFRPVIHNDFLPAVDDLPPFIVSTSLIIRTRDETNAESKYIYLRGYIKGVDIELLPKVVDFSQVYFGEEHCAQIEVINLDDICEAHVDFHKIVNNDSGQVLVTPKEGLTLKPQATGIFNLQFYSIVVGNFMIKLEFKVQNGGIFSIIVKGYSQHVHVKCFPEVIDLGDIPIAMPQKRLVLLMNPLMIPITVQCSVKDDGYETPLVLNAYNINENLPINVNDPIQHLNQSIETELYQEKGELKDISETQYSLNQVEQSLESFNSIVEDNSSYSTEFQELALDFIPNISNNLVSFLKKIEIFDKPEMEQKVVETTLNALLETPYFLDLNNSKNYIQMDWNSLATDPKEIYCNNEIIYLKPNTGKTVSIVVIPNVIGSYHKYIEIRICPIMQQCMDDEKLNLSRIVDTAHMISKLWINYNCLVPEVIWDNVIIMQEQIYAGEYYDFQMTFKNNSNIGGFFHYDVVPNSNLGIMKFANNKWKYFIEPNAKIYVPCKVKFKNLGFICLAGLIKFVGSNVCYSFHIKSQVLPPKIRYNPRIIDKTVNVLETCKLFLFIENATPTTTWFSLKLKDESIITIEPHGAQLAPTRQAIYVTFNIYCRDPGLYKNILYIIMEFETIEKIPITIHVKGMPVFFEPEIHTKELDIGYILCNTKEIHDKDSYSKIIKVKNKGLHHYRLIITRTKCSDKSTCRTSSLKAKITIKPNNFIVKPLSETYFTIFINCCEAIKIFNEFRIELSDLSDVKNVQIYRFILKATFIMPQLTWSRQDITMNYYRGHKYKEPDQWEIIKLTNVTANGIDSVNLTVKGPFKIKELFEHQFLNELNFSIAGLETKQFFVTLDKTLLRNCTNKFYERRIMCYANSIQQPPVCLKVKIFVPEITLKSQQVTLFTKNTENGTFLELINTGDMSAIYKWKKLKEVWHYINEEDDDSKQVASIILSDIIHMLEIQPINVELDSETNMTQRYQKYKCFLKYLDDPINIIDILYDIIEHIDLTGRRYKLCYDELQDTDDYLENIVDESCGINKTLSRLSLNDTELRINETLTWQMSKKQFYEKITEIEDNFNSNTIFLNRKFVPTSNSSCTTVERKFLNEETCALYTLDHIMNHLKLEDSYVLSSPSIETCDHLRSVYFFQKCGLLHKNEKKLCPLHIPPIRRGFEIRAMFELDVVGGKTQNFEITLVNLDKTIVLSKENIYLGSKPWYESYQTKIKIQNVTNYQVSLNIAKIPMSSRKFPELVTGSINIIGETKLFLMPFQSTVLQTKGIMGFNEDFKRDLRIIVNDGEELVVHFSGHGIMPILTNYKPKLSVVEKDPLEIIEEYRLLQKLYYFEIFKAITEKKENLLKSMGEKENEIESFPTDSTTLSTEISESTLAAERQRSFLMLMQSYVLVYNNLDLPNSTVLDQLLQTEKFRNHLYYKKETSSLLTLVYQNYFLHQKSCDIKTSSNLKHFTIQPLPYHLTSNILDMGKLYFNQYRKFVFQLEFVGPGKLIVAAKSVVHIPGLMVDFHIVENTDNIEFVYYRSEEKMTELKNKSYRNINERHVDAETNVKVKHAHFYDITSPLLQHQRDTNTKQYKWLRNYYGSLNKSIYVDQKNHITHCKIFSNCNCNFTGTKINLTLLFKPQKNHYKHNQKIEDYLYIDLHMGPTLPILLQGVVVDGNQRKTTIFTSLTT